MRSSATLVGAASTLRVTGAAPRVVDLTVGASRSEAGFTRATRLTGGVRGSVTGGGKHCAHSPSSKPWIHSSLKANLPSVLHSPAPESFYGHTCRFRGKLKVPNL